MWSNAYVRFIFLFALLIQSGVAGAQGDPLKDSLQKALVQAKDHTSKVMECRSASK
jgi:hypothetical protein